MVFNAHLYERNLNAADEQRTNDRKYRVIKVDEVPSYQLDTDVIEVKEVGGLKAHFIATQGHRPEMEDFHFACEMPSLPKNQVPDALEKAFDYVQEEVKKRKLISGSSAAVAHVAHYPTKHIVTVANAGDSRIDLITRWVSDGRCTVRRLSRDHRLSDPLESQRVQAEGGSVLVDHYGPYILSSSGKPMKLRPPRGLGDLQYLGVTHRPEVSQGGVSHGLDSPERQVFLMVSCDGLWEKQHESNIKDLWQQWGKPGEKIVLDEELLRLPKDAAIKSGSKDNISVGLIELTPDQKEPIVMAVHDGHGGAGVAKLASELMPQFLQSLEDPEKPSESAAAQTFALSA